MAASQGRELPSVAHGFRLFDDRRIGNRLAEKLRVDVGSARQQKPGGPRRQDATCTARAAFAVPGVADLHGRTPREPRGKNRLIALSNPGGKNRHDVTKSSVRPEQARQSV